MTDEAFVPTPAYRVETERTVVRCYQPADAPMLKEAIDASLEHLLAWLPWANDEPETIEAKVERLRTFRGKFDLDQDYNYGIFSADESHLFGGSALLKRQGAGSLEIGYWTHADHVNKGYATEVASALTKVGMELHQVQRIEIHCDPLNAASARVPEKLGFTHEGTLGQRLVTPSGESCDRMIWTLFEDAYEGSPARNAAIEAFDVRGNRLLPSGKTKSPSTAAVEK